jgi:hypothetical protein
MESHKSSGLLQPNKSMLQFFTALIITNVLSAAVQLSGGMLLALAAFGEDRFRVEVRQSVLLVCARSSYNNCSDPVRLAPAHMCSAVFLPAPPPPKAGSPD